MSRHKECLNWKVDRVLTNQRLNLIAGTEITSNVPKAWFLALVENRQEGKGNGIPRTQKMNRAFVSVSRLQELCFCSNHLSTQLSFHHSTLSFGTHLGLTNDLMVCPKEERKGAPGRFQRLDLFIKEMLCD